MASTADRVRDEVQNLAPDPATVRQDGIAGVINAVVSVPDGLAAATLVGVNPVFGLYASITGRFAGGLVASSQLMQIVTTSAAALAAGQAIPLTTENRAEAVFLLVALIGAFQIAFGLLRLGSLTYYVSHSVMTGFLIGVATLLVLDQLALFVKYEPEGANEISQTVDLFRNFSEFHFWSTAVGVLALGIIIGMGRTKWAIAGPLVALVVPTALVAIISGLDVDLVQDIGDIPRGLPPFGVPSFDALSIDLVASAAAIAAIIVVQGAGVGQSFPNRDGTSGDASRDFLAQGAGNVASGFFSGIPVGGSVGQTALNVSTGAMTRWSSIFASVTMLAIVLVVPGLVEQVPMAALGALMVMAGLGAINFSEAASIWRTGWSSRIPIVVTFLATLFVSIPVAVAVGVLLSSVLYLSSASDVSVYELDEAEDGTLTEKPLPATLPSDAVTVIGVYGSLFFAGARILQKSLPSARGSQRPAVVIRLRGRTRIGATLVEVLRRYAADIAAVGGHLYLSGVGPDLVEHLDRTGKMREETGVTIVPATAVVGASSRAAASMANAWLAEISPA